MRTDLIFTLFRMNYPIMAENRRTKCVTFVYFKACMSTPTANKRHMPLKLEHNFNNTVYLQNETNMYISLFAFNKL